MTRYILLGVLAVVVLLAIIGLPTYFSYSNQEIGMRNEINAKIDDNKATFDNMWKILQTQASVTDKYKDGFKDVYANLMGERYKDGEAQLAKLVMEANPTFDSNLFAKLMDSITIERTKFLERQRLLIDKNREHTDLVTKFPGNFFLFRRQVIVVPVITSAKTEQVYQTKQENDVDLFSK